MMTRLFVALLLGILIGYGLAHLPPYPIRRLYTPVYGPCDEWKPGPAIISLAECRPGE